MTTEKYIIKQGYKYEGDDWWQWWIWIDGTENDLNMIDKVIYTLHPTFLNPVRTLKSRNTKFKLETSGWGGFTVYAKLILNNGEEIKLQHELKLEYGDNSSIPTLAKPPLIRLNKPQKIFIFIFSILLAIVGFLIFGIIGLFLGITLGLLFGLIAYKLFRKLRS